MALKKRRLIASAMLAVLAASGEDLARHVDPFIGTSYRGHTFPGAACPFGLVQPGPDTAPCDWHHCSGYVWEDRHVYGFTQNHLNGTGCPDLADVRLLPFSEDFAEADPIDWRGAKDARTETASPGYYAVSLTNLGARVEISATPRAAIYRITWEKGRRAKLLVDLQWGNARNQKTHVTASMSEVSPDGRMVWGENDVDAWLKRHFAFAVEFSGRRPSCVCLPALRGEKAAKRVFDFGVSDGTPLIVKAAVCTTDAAGARRNLAAEIPGWDFDGIRAAARARWNEVLGRMRAEQATDEQKKAFYSALYHLFLQPNQMADVDGRYRGGDWKVARAKGGAYYSGLSLWDTFRAAHPLYTILVPERVDGFVESMLAHFRATGCLPVIPYFCCESYCMIGTHSVPVVVDAWLKGFRGFDAQEAFVAVTNSLTVSHWSARFNAPKVKEDWKWLDTLGYYPFDKITGESVSRTLECGYNDWCAAAFARALGHAAAAEFFARRADGWKNVFDPSIGFVRGKDSAGRWREPYDPFALGHGADTKNDFTEGNAFQYTWHVLQDPEGLMDAMGGREAFVKKLDSLFTQPEKTEGMGFVSDVTGLIGQYAHGNEPSHHVAYLYTLAGRPDRTAEVVREVCDRFYLTTPGGLCGNDDCGQMSAWYLFGAMGFYPVNPCGGDYVLGAPQFQKVVLSVPRGTFTVIARNLSKENKYVKSAALNGKPFTSPILRHADVMAGGELVFEMCAERNVFTRGKVTGGKR